MRNNKGFTLIELMVATFVGLIVAAGLYILLSNQMRVYNVQQQIGDAQTNSRWLMQRMSRDIEMAGYNIAGAVFNPIVLANPLCLRYQSDLDADGSIGNVVDEDVTYCFNTAAKQIIRTVVVLGVQTGNVIAENIADLNFVYFDSNGVLAAVPAVPGNIRGIRIDMTVRTRFQDTNYTNPNPLYLQFHTVQLSTRIRPRNLGL